MSNNFLLYLYSKIIIMEKFKPIIEFDSIEEAVNTLNIMNKKLNDLIKSHPHLQNISFELNLRVTKTEKPVLYFNIVGRSTIIKIEEI